MAVHRKWSQAADIAVNDDGEQIVQISGTPQVQVGGTVQVSALAGRTIKYKAVNAASADAAGNTVIPAVTGKKIVVVSMRLMAAADVVATWYSGNPAAGGTALDGPSSLSARGGYAERGSVEDPLMETASDAALTLLLGAAVQCGGRITYFEA